MSFRTEKQDNYTIIHFSTDKLDAIVAPDLKSELILINKNGEKNILLDIESVKYCDSSGLSALLTGNRVCKESGGSLIISSPQQTVKKLLSISQLDTVLNITATLPEAIDMLYENELERGMDSNESNE